LDLLPANHSLAPADTLFAKQGLPTKDYTYKISGIDSEKYFSVIACSVRKAISTFVSQLEKHKTMLRIHPYRKPTSQAMLPVVGSNALSLGADFLRSGSGQELNADRMT